MNDLVHLLRIAELEVRVMSRPLALNNKASQLGALDRPGEFLGITPCVRGDPCWIAKGNADLRRASLKSDILPKLETCLFLEQRRSDRDVIDQRTWRQPQPHRSAHVGG